MVDKPVRLFKPSMEGFDDLKNMPCLKFGSGECMVLKASVSLASGLLMSFMGGSAVQAMADAEAPPAADTGQLEEVVVTAQRRAESAQKVPIPIVQFTPDALKSMGVTDTADLPLAVPGFQVAPTGAGQAYYLRGVGNNSSNPGVDSEVSTYVDGVYMPFVNGNLQNFNNIASLEVDKGPQGTLFGRNATGGVVQINTLDPSFTPSVTAKAGYGNYNTYMGSFYGTTKVVDNLAADLAVYINDQMNGWGHDLATGQAVFKNYDLGIRTKWLYDLSDSTSIRFSADYDETRGSVGADVKPATGYSSQFNYITGMSFAIPGYYNVDSDLLPRYEVKQEGANVKVNSDLGWAEGVSISAYRQERTSLRLDYDGSPIDFFGLFIDSEDAALSQEFQLLSSKGSDLNWVVGAFYYNETGQNVPFGFCGLGATVVFGAPLGQCYNIRANETTKSYAVYGQATKEILARTRLTLGYRYTIDDRSIHGETLAGSTAVPGTAGDNSVRFTKSTYRVSVDHDITDGILAYASHNFGYHAGTYNLNSAGGFSLAVNPPIKPEGLDAYEVGLKSEWLDKRLRVNGSGFWYKYSNLQQQEYQGAAVVTVNAAAARIRGIDLDITTQPVVGLTLSAAGEFLDAVFTSYPNAPIYTPIPNGPLLVAPGDASGNRMPNAPRFSANLSANYALPSGVGKFATTATLAYNGVWYADPSNNFKEPSYYLLNMSETWTSPDGRYNIELWSKNLTNREYDSSINVLSPVGYAGNPGAPRTFGIRFGVHL